MRACLKRACSILAENQWTRERSGSQSASAVLSAEPVRNVNYQPVSPPFLLNEGLCYWDNAVCVLTNPPGHSDGCQSLRLQRELLPHVYSMEKLD